MKCVNCGTENEPDSVFCSACNHFLQWEEPSRAPRRRRSRRSSDLSAALDAAALDSAPLASAALGADPDGGSADIEIPPEPEQVPTDTEIPPDTEIGRLPPEPVVPEVAAPTEPIRRPAVAPALEPERRMRTVPAEPAPSRRTRNDDAGARVNEILAAIDAGREIASSQGRVDLDQHLNETKQRLTAEQIQVVFCGQFKVGKSTMINALLQRAVCPVDADVVTAVPTVVRYADQPEAVTYVRTEDGTRISEQHRPLDEIDLLVTEEADPSDPERDRVVEVGLPHRMLRSGLALVDTPGVGGLDSAHGFLTLSALRHARGVVFVTDAAQELTAPELSFLRTAVERCPTTAVVVTKIDLYPHWRRIVDLDRQHLANAGLDLPIIAVSSFLRLRAAKDPGLNAESGFSDLVAFLARDVVAATRTHSAKAAAVEVDFVASQLEQQSQAERAVIQAPQTTEQVVAELDRVQEQAKRLIQPTATWQQTLSDGIQDLVADVEHDLQARLRTVLHDVDEVIDSGDPQDTWGDTEVWLRRQIAIVTMANRDLLTARAEELAQDVADHFELPAGSKLVLPLGGADGDAAALAPASTLAMPGGKLAPFLVAARSSYYLPMMLGSVAAGVLSGGIVIHLTIVGFSLVLGTGIGKKIIGDEKKRQRTFRQQQAKAAARRFVDEVAFALNKETRDILRTAQRHLRDDFQGRAMQLERSAHEAKTSARRLGQLGEDQFVARAQELQAREGRLESVRSAAREVAGPAEPVVHRG
ncbi:MAG: dynamin family protein [Candidatus Nanopelagicales bacterium]